jgi:tetratricopeptide (TPR) repeat protein
VAAFDDALCAQPGELAALRGRAESLFRLRRYPDAVAALDDLLRRGGDAPAARYQARAVAKVKLGDNRAALDDLTLALERTPGDAGLLTQRGQTHLACQSWDLALRDFEAALKRRPESAAALQGRGLARARLGRAREAAADAERVLRRAGDDAAQVYGGACVYAQAAARAEADADRAGYAARAEDCLERAVRLLPEDRRGRFWRGTARRDGALAPLRRGPAFDRLDREYGGAGPGN